ncbi:MAG: hypothetical protein CV087_14655 [Candidatus Brocadia sp. WS118]|nr:MAG: hypothetical protein CV087_14655 [Candidatus Brocadia sp. WS118]
MNGLTNKPKGVKESKWLSFLVTQPVIYIAFAFVISTAIPAQSQDFESILSPKSFVLSSTTADSGKGASVPGHLDNQSHQNTVKNEVNQKIGKIHIPFIANEGQSDKRVKFYANTFGGTVFITKNGEIVYSLPKFEKRKALKEDFNPKSATRNPKSAKRLSLREKIVGGSVKEVRGDGKAITRVSYFKGNDPFKWKSNIPTYDLVSLGEVYKGVELKLKAYGKNVEKLFYVKPGAEPEKIRVRLSGGRLNVNKDGELEVETAFGVVKFTKPVTYQENRGKKKFVEVAYVVRGNEYGFKVGEYDREKELVIDPLLASTFLGSSMNNDTPYSIAISGGDVYVAGETHSSDFPTTPGAYDTSFNGGSDVFVAKLNESLTDLLASTFLGGSGGNDRSFSLEISGGNVYVAGFTPSTDFPTTPGAYDTSFNGDSDVFVAKFNGSLTDLLASTFLGGSSRDSGNSIAISGSNVYVAGSTRSSDFPTTPGAYDTSFNGGSDVFVAKLNESLTDLLASTFLGGSSIYNDGPNSIAILGSNVYVAGETLSTDFPTTPGAYDTSFNGASDVFVSKFNGSLTDLLASTFLGGSRAELVASDALMAISGSNVYVAGETVSTDFPTTPGAYDTSFNFARDAFVSKFDPNLGTTLIDFNDERSLAALSYKSNNGNIVTAARFTFVYPTKDGGYKEDGMLFITGVHPEDPRVGGIDYGEYHLMYENCEALSLVVEGKLDPEKEPRMLTPHSRDAIIQMTYDPDNNGTPDPFNLISIVVRQGKLNVGIKFSDETIGIFNNLTAPPNPKETDCDATAPKGTKWFLIGGKNLTRATLEGSSESFTIDDIEFEEATQSQSTSLASTSSQPEFELISQPLTVGPTLLSHASLFKFEKDFYLSDSAPAPKIDIIPGNDTNPINLKSKGVIPVGILTTDGFNATSVDPFSVVFGPNEAREADQQGQIEDVDGDGDMDLKLDFRVQEAGIRCDDTSLSLRGQTFDGEAIAGVDFIKTEGCVINDLVSFQPIRSTYETISDTAGCTLVFDETSEDVFVGQFSFDARLENKSNSSLTGLVVEVTKLTNGNVLQNADEGPGGVGSRLTVPVREDDYSDGVLGPGEFVDVHFIICLKDNKPFTFLVNVLGSVIGSAEEGETDSLQDAEPQSTRTEPSRIKFRKGSRVHGKGFFGRFRPK